MQGVRGARFPRREARTRTGEKGAAWIIAGSAKPSRETQGKEKDSGLPSAVGLGKAASQPEWGTLWEPGDTEEGCPRGDACERQAERSVSGRPLPAGLGGGAWAAGQRSPGSKRGKCCSLLGLHPASSPHPSLPRCFHGLFPRCPYPLVSRSGRVSCPQAPSGPVGPALSTPPLGTRVSPMPSRFILMLRVGEGHWNCRGAWVNS